MKDHEEMRKRIILDYISISSDEDYANNEVGGLYLMTIKAKEKIANVVPFS